MARTFTVEECARIVIDHVGSRIEDVLAVVEKQQPRPALQRRGDAVGHTQSRLLGDPEYRRDRLGHCCRVAHSGQLDHPHAIREVVFQTRGDLKREPRLADPANACQRH